MEERTCPMCDNSLRVEKAEFNIEFFVFRGGRHKGQIGLTIMPEGTRVEKCYTNEGCGEEFMSGEEAGSREMAAKQISKMPLYDDLMKFIEIIRQETKIK